MNNALDNIIFDWNVRFRLDRRWRKKYNIPFGSKEHLESNQIDIFLDLREDELFDKLKEDYVESIKNKEEFKKNGKFLKSQIMSQKDEDDLVNKIKLSL